MPSPSKYLESRNYCPTMKTASISQDKTAYYAGNVSSSSCLTTAVFNNVRRSKTKTAKAVVILSLLTFSCLVIPASGIQCHVCNELKGAKEVRLEKEKKMFFFFLSTRFLTGPFTISEPQDQEISQFSRSSGRATDFESQKL